VDKNFSFPPFFADGAARRSQAERKDLTFLFSSLLSAITIMRSEAGGDDF